MGSMWVGSLCLRDWTQREPILMTMKMLEEIVQIVLLYHGLITYL